MIASLNPQEEKTLVVLVLKVLKQFERDIRNPGMISPMHSGTTLIILCKVIEVSRNGYSQVRIQMESGLKLRAAIYLHSVMERFLSKTPIEKIDH